MGKGERCLELTWDFMACIVETGYKAVLNSDLSLGLMVRMQPGHRV